MGVLKVSVVAVQQCVILSADSAHWSSIDYDVAMMTPAHIAAGLFVWRDQPSWRRMAAVVAGASFPDLTMVGFYAYQKTVGTPEAVIWSERYFAEEWQLVFDLCNSIPIAIFAVVVFARLNRPVLWLFSASALLHMLCDLPVHHHDAHRHFLPISQWRFESPVSYWNPEFHGREFAIAEFLFAVGASVYVAFRAKDLPMRIAGGANAMLYFFGLMMMGIIWLQLRP